MDYKANMAILNGEVECSSDDYDEAVKDANKCINLLIEVAKLVNDPTELSSLTVEKIRNKLNRELKDSNESFIYEW